MGSELVSGSLPQEGGEFTDSTTLSYTQIFYKHLPYYLAIGMPVEVYWDGDCVLTRSYRTADELKQKRVNQNAWLQGMYIYEALCNVSPILHAFAKKSAKPIPYPSEPYATTRKELEEKHKNDERKKFEKMKAKMSSWSVRTNAQINMRKEGEDG